MKLFVQPCSGCGRKIYLTLNVRTRGELRAYLGGDHFNVTCGSCITRNMFSVYDVIAESETSNAVTGGLVGGLIGLLGGPLGALIGGGIGATIGNTSDDDERRRVNYFNSSR